MIFDTSQGTGPVAGATEPLPAAPAGGWMTEGAPAVPAGLAGAPAAPMLVGGVTTGVVV
ncbi:MAG TPA: hypothetical protein VJV78_19970 [Polyangiales bacterium]|nr:hypothetical protein [Polyangiales bacterium]